MADLTRTQMTIEEFRQLPESIERIELIHGELMVSPTPQHKHQRLVLGLATLVDNLKSMVLGQMVEGATVFK